MRRWLWLSAFGVAILVVAVVVALAALPELVRRTAISQLQAATGRTVTIEGVDLDLIKGRFAIRRFRVADRDGSTTLGDFERLDARIDLVSLLTGHLWVRDLTIENSTVNVVRHGPREFNISDLIRGSGGGGQRALDVTVDRFALVGGTVNLEDRVLTPSRTWTSENIAIEARNVSTRRGDGTAVGSSITAGAPVSVKVEDLRLYPIHLRAEVSVKDLDLALARLYTPPDVPVAVDRGRVAATVGVRLDAQQGIRIDGDVRLADAVLVRPGGTDPLVTAPSLTVSVADLSLGNGSFRLERLEIGGQGSVFDRRVTPVRRYEVDGLRVSAEGVTWPVTGPARIAITSGVPGGGQLDVRGTAQMNPAAAQVRVRLTGTELAAWSQFLPARGRLTGRAAADLAINAELGTQVRARAAGAAHVSGLAMTDAGRRLVNVEQVSVTGIAWEWPSRMSLDRVHVRRPSAVVERDTAGDFPLLAVVSGNSPSAPGQRAPVSEAPGGSAPPVRPAGSAGEVMIGEIRVEDGAISWRDASVSPAARLELTGIQLTAHGGSWPLRAPVRVHASTRTPGGGEVSARGLVRLEPVSAELRIAMKGVDLAPYHPYLPIAAQVGGRTSAELAVAASRASTLEATVTGRADVSSMVVADKGRPLVKVARAEAAGLAIEWPRRVLIERLTLRQPAAVIEREQDGRFPLRNLLETRTPSGLTNGQPASGTSPSTGQPAPGTGKTDGDAGATGSTERTALEIRQLDLVEGSARFVDRTVSPVYVEDLWRLNLRLGSVTTASATPARLAVNGRLGRTGTLELSGQVTPFAGPLFVDVVGRLRDFEVPRVNRYLEQMTAWSARDGRLSVEVRCKIQGDELEARNEIHLARLQVVRAGQHDEAKQRIGLPLGMIVALMKDSRGEIHLPLPVGGRLSDPRFELGEAIWGAVRTITVKMIALPVSWIGRIRFGQDSRVEDISVNPAPFEAGTATATSEGTQQLERITGFLRQRPDARMVLTAVVTLGDIEDLKRQEVRARIEQLAEDERLPPPEAARRVHARQFPGREVPPTLEEIIAAVSADLDPPAAAAQRLAKERVEAVRRALKESGIDPARLQPNTDVEAVETMGGGSVEFLLTDQVRPRRRLLAELLQKLAEMVARLRSSAGRA